MGYLRGYEFVNINRNINNYLKLSKKIRFLFNCWNNYIITLYFFKNPYILKVQIVHFYVTSLIHNH